MSLYMFSRADAASKVSGAANTAMSLSSPNEAYKTCVLAKSEWTYSRKESNALASTYRNTMDEGRVELDGKIDNIATALSENQQVVEGRLKALEVGLVGIKAAQDAVQAAIEANGSDAPKKKAAR